MYGAAPAELLAPPALAPAEKPVGPELSGEAPHAPRAPPSNRTPKVNDAKA
jgi:hypothetical protein